jgi:hypothetical protein
LFTGENFGKQLLKIADPPLTRVNSACLLILSDLEWSLPTAMLRLVLRSILNL